MELLKRIETSDPNARFILVGDIVSRGSEDAQMLAWAYENITLDGKYQMVLGFGSLMVFILVAGLQFITIDYKSK